MTMTVPHLPNPNPPADVPPDAPRAGVYLRESHYERDKYGIPVQRRLCRDYCHENGYAPTAEYLDNGEDSAEVDRPAMNAMRQDMQAGRLDVVVIARYDRLGRDLGLQEFLLYEATKIYDVSVEFADPNEQFDDSPTGRLMRSVKGWANEEDRRLIRQKTQAARRARAEEGKIIPGNKAPYGYVWRDGHKTAWEVDPLTAPIVRRMYAEVAAGSSLAEVAEKLTAEGVPLPTQLSGGAWRAQSIRRLLRRSAYIGIYDAYHTKHTKKRRELPAPTRSSKTYYITERPLDDPARVRMPVGVVPPLVDRETWQTVQHLLDANKKASARHNREPEATLLRGGIVVCGHCARSLHALRHNTQRKVLTRPAYWRYRCDRSPCEDRCPHHSHSISAPQLDTAVWTLFADYFLAPERLQTFYAGLTTWAEEQQQQQGATALDERHVLNVAARAKELDGEVARLGERIGKEADDEVAGILRARLRAVLDERAGLRTLHENAQKEYAERQARLSQRMAFVEFATAARERLLGPDTAYAVKRGLLDAFEARVVVWHTEHAPRWVLLLGFETLVDDMLAGQATTFPLFLPTGVPAEREVMEAVMRDLQPVLEREIAWRLSPRGRRGGPATTSQRLRQTGSSLVAGGVPGTGAGAGAADARIANPSSL